MSQGLATLRKRLEELRGAGSRLGRTLRSAALELDARGTPFAPSLLQDLRTYRRDVDDLRARTLEAAADEVSRESVPAEASLGELSAVLRRADEQMKRRERARRSCGEALAVLGRVDAIRCRDDAAFAPLIPLREEAAQLRDAIEGAGEFDVPEAAESLIRGEHRLCGLLTLVEGTEALDDERWGVLLDDVTRHFGRALSAAVARGRLHAVATPASAATPTRPVVSVSPAPIQPSCEVDVEAASLTVSTTPERNVEKPAAPVAPAPVEASPRLAPEASSTPKPPAAVPHQNERQGAPPTVPRPVQRTTRTPLNPSRARPQPVAPPASGVAPRAQTPPTSETSALQNGTKRADVSHEKAGEKPAAPRIDLDDAASDDKSGTAQEGAVIMRNATASKTTASSKTLAGSVRIGGRRAQPLTVLAQAALDATGQERDRLISNLIWRLALEGRIGIASHLSRCLERRNDVEVQYLPSTLLHAMCLAPHVQFPQGETARQLIDDFSRLRFMQGPRNDAEWAVAWQLLLTAAALRPALIAPPCGASAVLHNMRMIEGLSRLYNYTHRIAIFADAGRPLDVNTFKRARSEQAWEVELEQFLAEVEAWCGQTATRRVRYTATTHCFLRSHWSVSRGNVGTEGHSRSMWRIWQSTMNALHAMLEPVRQNRIEDREKVRADADRLSDPAEIDRLTSGAQVGRQAGGNVDATSREQLRLIVTEATGLARRWLRIHDTPPERRTPAIPRRAEELLEERRSVQLREEVVSRQDAVLKELKAVSERYTSLPIVTAIACCCRAIEQIRRLFDADEPVATSESDPRLLFNSELLRIPSLALNDAWEPEVSLNELENDLLQLLTRGAPDWRAAFDARCEEGDHEATRRLLELPVWLDEAQHGQLVSLREAKLEQCRQSLRRDVVQTRTRVAEAYDLGLIQERDRDDFNGGIDTVETSASVAQRFAHWHRRLSEIRESLERRRHYEIEKVRQRFDMLHLRSEDPVTARIDAALNDGNIVSANRYLEMAETGVRGEE